MESGTLLILGTLAVLVILVIWLMSRNGDTHDYTKPTQVRRPPTPARTPTRIESTPPIRRVPPTISVESEPIIKPAELPLQEAIPTWQLSAPEPLAPVTAPEIAVPSPVITPMREVVILREELEPKDTLIAREIQESRKPNGIFVVMKTELITQISELAKIRHMSRSAICRELIVRGMESLYAELSAEERVN
jgi:hypothetical protein